VVIDIDTVRGAVADAYAASGNWPAWPDAHLLPDGTRRESFDEEYSRVSDPQKYRVVGGRVDGWVTALTALGLAELETVDASVFADPSAALDPVQVLRLRPYREGAIPLLFAVRSVLAERDNVVLGAGEPAAAVVDRNPDCGCDACDSGSAALLEVLDDGVLDVVRGDLVHVVLDDGSTIVGRRNGWSATGSVPGQMPSSQVIEAAIADVRAGNPPGPAIFGAAWW
jgi:hypothetical protein